MTTQRSLRARIVSQGEELLTGQTLDTNAHFLAARLTELGFRVWGAATAGDRKEAIVDVLRIAADDADVVICTGGLGPTGDDLTAEAAAEAFGSTTALDEEALQQVVARYARVGRPMAESNRKQAVLPVGSTLLPNPIGTAPGFALQAPSGARLYFVPGVPREMRRMWDEQVKTDLLDRFEVRPPQRAILRVLGLGESQLQDLLSFVEEQWPGVELGFRTRPPENQVKLVAEPDVPGFADATSAVREKLGKHLFSESEDRELAAIVGDLLVERGQTLALAESCTGGLIGHLCVSESGSSRWLERGWVTYSNRSKVEEVGVPRETLDEHGAVSEETARAMAQGAKSTAGTDWGLGITGIAGPGGGTKEKPVGTVWIAIAGPGGTYARRLPLLATGRRNTTRAWSATLALEMLRRQLLR